MKNKANKTFVLQLMNALSQNYGNTEKCKEESIYCFLKLNIILWTLSWIINHAQETMNCGLMGWTIAI